MGVYLALFHCRYSTLFFIHDSEDSFDRFFLFDPCAMQIIKKTNFPPGKHKHYEVFKEVSFRSCVETNKTCYVENRNKAG